MNPGYCVKKYDEEHSLVATTQRLEGEAFEDFKNICKANARAQKPFDAENYGWVVPTTKIPKVEKLLAAIGLEKVEVKPRREPVNELEQWAAGCLLEIETFEESAGDIGPKLQKALTRRGGELSERQWAAVVAIALKHKSQASELPPARDFKEEPKGAYKGHVIPVVVTASVAALAMTLAGLFG